MKRAAVLAGVLVWLLGGASLPASATPVPVDISVAPSRVETGLGDRFVITTEVHNTGSATSGPLVAHLNVASLESNVYVDPEDWSSDRSQELSLQGGERRRLSWDVQAVNSGRFGAYVVVLPADSAAGAQELVVSPMATLDVAPRSTRASSGLLLVVFGVPALLGLIVVGTRVRLRRAP